MIAYENNLSSAINYIIVLGNCTAYSYIVIPIIFFFFFEEIKNLF